MWPFKRDKPLHELGNDVPSVLDELRNRRHWKRLPPALIQEFGVNATHVFDRPGEATDALMRLVMLLESDLFPNRLRQIADAENWRYEMSILSAHLQQCASLHEESAMPAVADSAAVAQLVCERFDLFAYCALARMSVSFGRNVQEATLWCDRYRQAESELLREDEANLSITARATRECLDPDKLRQTAEEMRRILPRHLLDKHCPDFDASDCYTPRHVIEQIEDLTLEVMCVEA